MLATVNVMVLKGLSQCSHFLTHVVLPKCLNDQVLSEIHIVV